MKYIKLFESFSANSDADAIKKIMEVSNEPWFINGDDAPEEFIDSLDNFESDDEEIQNAVEICTGGPGYTDIWLENDELISDAMSEDPELTEEEIDKSNRKWFSRERAKVINFIQNEFLSPNNITERASKDPKILNFIEKLDPELYRKVLKDLGWDKMGPDLLRQLKDGIL